MKYINKTQISRAEVLRAFAGFNLSYFTGIYARLFRNANFGRFKDAGKILIIYLFCNKLHQCEPYKNLSLSITYKNVYKNIRSFSNLG